MKARTIALASVLGLLTVALTVASVIGLTYLLAPGQDRPLAKHGPEGERFAPGDPAAGPVAFAPDFDFGDDAEIPLPRVEDKGRPLARVGEVRGPVVAAGEMRVSGPFKHDNLSIFLVHGPNKLADAKILTLQEALDANLAVVHEGLSITNMSDKAVFVQAGDIVKGGTQDRVLPYDYLIPANAKRFPVAALCVESGRCMPRGSELSTSFAISCERLPTKDLRRAAYGSDQGSVWAGVKRTQDALHTSLGVPVRSLVSPTSLQLTLEHPAVVRGITQHVDELGGVAAKAKDAIGMVVVVNGKVVSADMYASSELFQKLYGKLLRAAAIEALATPRLGAFEQPTTEAVLSFLTVSDSAPAHERATGGRLHLITQELPTALVYDTCDREAAELVFHRTLLSR